MKLLFFEFPANYGKYYFPYQVLLAREGSDDLSKIYSKGFLPFRSIKNLYYLCRSVRVDLGKFELSSENRRILKKTDIFKWKLVKLDRFDYTPGVQKTCKEWFNQKFGQGQISVAAIRKIFTAGIFTHVFVWEFDNDVVGQAIVFINNDLVHYAHLFYNPRLAKSNLGVRMMLQAVIWSQENRKKFVYLGTCYTRSSLYKTEFSGLEFFNGFSWSDNIKELKYLIDRKSDDYLFQDKEYLRKYKR